MTFTETPTPDLTPEGSSGEGGAPPVEPSGEAGIPSPEGEGLPDPSGSGEGGEGAPAPAYLDPEQFGSHLVKVTVQGNEVELPFAEAVKGIMLQQDYTQKTQGLAEERRKLQQADALVAALEADPVGTLKQLSDIYDLTPSDGGFSPVERDPQEQRLVEMERTLAAQQEAFARQQIEAEVAAIRAEHGDFDVMATAQFARDRGLRLADAFNLMQFHQLKQQQAETAQQEQRRQAALATQVAHQGTSTQRGTVQPGTNKPVTSLRDAWELAKQQTK